MTHNDIKAELLDLRSLLTSHGLTLHGRLVLWEAAEIVGQSGRLETVNRELGVEVQELRAALKKIDEILTRPAGNMRLMQIADPARRCRKIVKKALQGGAE